MSRSAASAMFIVWVASALAAGPAAAGDSVDTPVAETAPAAPAVPVIEIVREGGVAEAWREEGSAFATYGPDGKAVVPTAEQQARQALANAYDVQFLRLRGTGESTPDALDTCTAKPGCIAGRPVVARAPGDTVARYAVARAVAAEALDEAKPGRAADVPAFTHAVTYSSDGHAWELLLCFDCRRYGLRRDGIDVGAGIAGGVAQRAAFDAVLDEAR